MLSELKKNIYYFHCDCECALVRLRYALITCWTEPTVPSGKSTGLCDGGGSERVTVGRLPVARVLRTLLNSLVCLLGF